MYLESKKADCKKMWHIFSKFFFSLYTWSQKLLTAKTETNFFHELTAETDSRAGNT